MLIPQDVKQHCTLLQAAKATAAAAAAAAVVNINRNGKPFVVDAIHMFEQSKTKQTKTIADTQANETIFSRTIAAHDSNKQ